jgi:pilus assembly protein CpaF
MQDIFVFNQTGYGQDGKVEGYYSATGNIPYFIEELRQRGALQLNMDVFVPRS